MSAFLSGNQELCLTSLQKGMVVLLMIWLSLLYLAWFLASVYLGFSKFTHHRLTSDIKRFTGICLGYRVMGCDVRGKFILVDISGDGWGVLLLVVNWKMNKEMPGSLKSPCLLCLWQKLDFKYVHHSNAPLHSHSAPSLDHMKWLHLDTHTEVCATWDSVNI